MSVIVPFFRILLEPLSLKLIRQVRESNTDGCDHILLNGEIRDVPNDVDLDRLLDIFSLPNNGSRSN